MTQEKNKFDEIVNTLILTKTKQKIIAENVDVSQGYISRINKRLSQMKYLPSIRDNMVVCLECGSDNDLVIHHDHNTGQPICILCRKCNSSVGNKTEFDGNLSKNGYNPQESTFRDGFTSINLDSDDLKTFIDKWKADNFIDKHLSPTQIIGRYILKYIHNEVKENGKKSINE